MARVLEVPGRTCNPASELLRELGLDGALVDELLPLQVYHHLSAREQWERVEATLQRVVESFDLRALPVLLATRPYAMDLPILGVAALSAPDLAHALERIARFRSIWERTTPVHLVGWRSRSRPRLELEAKRGGDVGAQVLREGVLASMLQYARAVSNRPVHPQRVLLSHPPPAEAGLIEAYFEAPVVFRAACDALEFDAETLATPTRRADPLVSDVVLGYLDALASSIAADLASIPARTRVEVRSRLEGGLPGGHDVAKALGTSERTLRRRLREAGTSFAAIVESVRAERACELLATTRRPVTRIALDVGFAYPSAFSRAFLRWRGEPPSRYRARLRPAGAGGTLH
jgi:AraC-like DNA-binding protein